MSKDHNNARPGAGVIVYRPHTRKDSGSRKPITPDIEGLVCMWLAKVFKLIRNHDQLFNYYVVVERSNMK